jgi:hypothetical protein
MRTSQARWILVAAFLLVPLGASAQTPDSARYWTTVGSTGTLDEKSEGKVFFDRAVVQKGDTPVVGQAGRQPRAEGVTVDVTDSAVIRYNVTAVDGLFEGNALGMTIRFRDEGAGAQVIAKLIAVDLTTGTKTTLLTFDSDAPGVPAASGYHVWDVFDCKERKQPFDFVRNAYYVDATLTNSSIVTDSVAGIEIIQVYATTCFN